MKSKFLVAVAVAAAGSAACAQFAARAATGTASPAMAHQDTRGVPAVLNFKMKSLGGEDVDLAKYKGKVVLIVNTASKCGFTPQYAGLEQLHEKYADKGLVILGFPSNDFGQQGARHRYRDLDLLHRPLRCQIRHVLESRCQGPQHLPAVQEYLITTDAGSKPTVDVEWNFEKFLIGRDGHLAGRYLSAVTPMSDRTDRRCRNRTQEIGCCARNRQMAGTDTGNCVGCRPSFFQSPKPERGSRCRNSRGESPTICLKRREK